MESCVVEKRFCTVIAWFSHGDFENILHLLQGCKEEQVPFLGA